MRMKKKYYMAILVPICNEKEYLKEFLDYHFNQGIDIAIIYDHLSEDDPLLILQTYIDDGMVKYHNRKKHEYRSKWMWDAINLYKNDVEWFVMIDIDEFIYSRKYKTLKENIIYFDKMGKDCIHINWLCFGSNGIKKKTDDFVTQRFTRCSDYNFPMNYNTKVICKADAIEQISGSIMHYPILKKDKFRCNSAGKNYELYRKKHLEKLKRFALFFKKNNMEREWNKIELIYPDKEAQIIINHYLTKSEEEYLSKNKKYHMKNEKYSKQFFNLLNLHCNKYINKNLLIKQSLSSKTN